MTAVVLDAQRLTRVMIKATTLETTLRTLGRRVNFLMDDAASRGAAIGHPAIKALISSLLQYR